MTFATQTGRRGSRLKAIGFWLALLLFAAPQAFAGPAWILDPANSTLTYQSVKKNTIVETNTIRNIAGRIDPDGNAKVQFDLDSVDTGIDLRNVRMRFLFFETYSFPTATVTLKLDPAQFADLVKVRRMTVPLTFTLNLHGVDKELKGDAIVTMLTEGSVSVASKAPIAVHVEDFGLLPNIDKLQQAANVTNIVPTASVSFDFVFNAEGSASAAATANAAPAPAEPAAANGAMSAPSPGSTPQAE